MPRNGSGTYIPPDSTWNPATPNVTILSGDWNALLADLSLAITQSMATDGTTTFSASIPFAQGLTFAGGSLSAPGIGVIGDTNTGFNAPGVGQIGVVADGVQVMLATSTSVTFPVGVTFTGSPSISGNLTVQGNTTLGNAPGDTLTVAATGTFTGDQTFSGSITVPDASFSNAKLANMATQAIKGRTTAGTGAPEDLTATQATAIMNAVVGDSGSGGTKGLVPAPASGDAAAGKVLGAAGAWVAQAIKAYGLFTGSSGATVVATGISISRVTTGSYTVALSPAMANANYMVFCQPIGGTSVGQQAFVPRISSKVAGGFSLDTVETSAGVPVGYDPTQICIVVIA